MAEYRYGIWAGNPKGFAEDKTRCISVVWDKRAPISSQCSFKRGKGPDGLYCTRHGQMATERQERKEKQA